MCEEAAGPWAAAYRDGLQELGYVFAALLPSGTLIQIGENLQRSRTHKRGAAQTPAARSAVRACLLLHGERLIHLGIKRRRWFLRIPFLPISFHLLLIFQSSLPAPPEFECVQNNSDEKPPKKQLLIFSYDCNTP